MYKIENLYATKGPGMKREPIKKIILNGRSSLTQWESRISACLFGDISPINIVFRFDL